MKNPVTISSGKTYEEEAIKKWLESNDLDYVTQEKLSNKILMPNNELKKEIDAFKLCSDHEMLSAIKRNALDEIKLLNYPEDYFNHIYQAEHNNDLGMKSTFLFPAIHSDGIVQFMLEHGAKVNARDSANQTPLHLAATFRCIHTIRILLKKGADIEAKDNRGNTPLHNLDYRNFVRWKRQVEECAKEFLEHDANPNSKNTNGDTPCDLALKNQNQELTELIAKYDVKALSRKIEALEEKNILLEHSMEMIKKQIAQLMQLMGQTKLENHESKNTDIIRRKWGAF